MKRSTDPRNIPPAVKRKALKLYGEGHSAVAVARELNVHPDSVRRWAKHAKVTRGKLADVLIEKEELMASPLEADESLPSVRMLRDAERQGEFRGQLATTNTPSEQYRAMVIANGVRMLDAAFKAPPAVRNMRDLKTLTEIVGDALGVGGKRGSGGKIAIDLHVLTPTKEIKTVDAEIIESS